MDGMRWRHWALYLLRHKAKPRARGASTSGRKRVPYPPTRMRAIDKALDQLLLIRWGNADLSWPTRTACVVGPDAVVSARALLVGVEEWLIIVQIERAI